MKRRAPRSSEQFRSTKETDITVKLGLDGSGRSSFDLDIPFLCHMLELFAKHGIFDLSVTASGDTHIDDHHLAEDLGIVLGAALKDALGDKSGIARYGSARVPMDETLAEVDVDLSGRPFLVYRAEIRRSKVGTFDTELVEDFFRAFAMNAAMNLHINVPYGRNSHHIIEGIFKAFGRAIRQAVTIDPRIVGAMSTKGSI